MKKFAVLAAGCAAIAIGIGVAGYQAAADNGGTISGTVKFDGTPPTPKKVEVTKDKEVCGLKPHFEQELVVSSGGGIANAVVVLKDAKGTAKPGDVKFDQQGDKKPEGPPTGWAPDLGLAHSRLNPEWILLWLKNPQAVQPGTKMPSFYPGGPDDILGGKEPEQIKAIRDYIFWFGTHPGQALPSGTPVKVTSK